LSELTNRLRLVLIFIELSDYDKIQLEIDKIRNAFLADEDVSSFLNKIQGEMSHGHYAKIHEMITLYNSNNSSLTKWTNPKLVELKIKKSSLVSLIVVTQQKLRDAEKKVFIFNNRFNSELGSLILKYLELKKEKAKSRYEDNPSNKAYKENYKNSQDAFNTAYQDQNEEENKTIIELNENDSLLLKKTFRKATMLCHPDIVGQDEKLISMYHQLIEAYNTNDLEKVTEIFKALSTRSTIKDLGNNEIELLSEEIASLENKLEKLNSELKQFITSDVFLEIESISNYDVYFEEKRNAILERINSIS